MNEIVVISGKGGTGKTSITAAFAYFGKDKIVTADADVDASDLHLILNPQILQTEDFYSSIEAVIDKDKCIACDECFRVCHFDAIDKTNNIYTVIPLNCEGCGYCEKVCPTEAIIMKPKLDGQWFVAKSKFGSYLIFAKLGIGTENSGKLVSTVKNIAIQKAAEINSNIILVDGPPGIGCPVISSLSGSYYAVLVSEPTVSGVHDLKRVFQIAKRFNVRTGVIINKADLNKQKKDEIYDFIKSENIDFLGEIPYDEIFAKSLAQGKAVTEFEPENKISAILKNIWDKILKINNLKI